MRTLIAPRHAALAAGLLGERRLAELAGVLSTAYVADVARELGARGEVSLLARLATRLPPPKLRACAEALDPIVLLHTAAEIPDDGLVASLVAALPDARLRAVLRAAHEHGAWPLALDVVGRLGPVQRRRLAILAAEQDNAALRELARVARAEGRLGEVLAFLPALARRRLS